MTEENDRPGSPPEHDQMELGGEETVGEILVAAREKTGLTLEVVSQETKIPVSTLKYLETDNFEAIPASVYAKGFLRTYSHQLGLDTSQLINKYEIQTGQTHMSRGDLWEIEEEIVEEELDSPHLLRRFVIPAVLVIIAIIVLWKVFGGGEEGSEPPSDLPEIVSNEPVVDVTGGLEAEAVEEAVEGEEEHRIATTEQAPTSAVEGPSGETVAYEMNLRITAEERIWFDLIVYNRTNTGLDSIATDFILEPGEFRTFTSNEYFYIRKIGKTGGFSILLDGRPFEIPVVEGRLPRDIKISRSR